MITINLDGCAVFPEGIEKIESMPLSAKNELKTAIIPETVRSIESSAFSGCNNLETVVLPEGLELVDAGAFTECRRINKIIVNCPPEAIKNGAFPGTATQKIPEFYCGNNKLRFSEVLRICGKCELERVRKLEIPKMNLLFRTKLNRLVSACSEGNHEAMVAVAEFFLNYGNAPFYEAAANFWYYRAAINGNQTAVKIISEKLEERREQLPSVSSPYIFNESGERLNALGFSFFDSDREYRVSAPDENGIAEVTSYADEDGPDEDGFGMETYYDWWYLDENLQKIPGVKCIPKYSNREKRLYKEKFDELYNKAAEIVKSRKGKTAENIRKPD